MENGTLIVAMEALLVFGGAVAFAIWQLRSIKKDQEKARAEKEARTPEDPSASVGPTPRGPTSRDKP
jgi:hypothetical protein